MKLYGTAGSPFTSRVLLYAKLKGIDLPLVPAPAQEAIIQRMMERMTALQKDPAAQLPTVQIMDGTPFMKEINPLGRIPALEVDGRYLSESTTICEYLEDRFPNPPLLPADLYDRARVRLLCRMCDLYVASQSAALIPQVDPLTRDNKRLGEIKDYLKISLRELEAVMGPGLWAYGNAVSLADCVLVFTLLSMQTMLYVMTTENLGITAFDPSHPFSENPKLAAWWRHMQSQPVISQKMRENVEDTHKVLGSLIPDRSPSAFGILMRARSMRP